MHYVMSDIHGNRRRFDAVMSQIDLQPEDTLYVLGDVIDRHPYGIELLWRLMKMPNACLLLGNHEFMMLNALRERGEAMPWPQREESLEHWFYNGGEPTLEAFRALTPTQQNTVKEYLKTRPLSAELTVNGRMYRLVHAAPVELFDAAAAERYTSETEFAVWYRLEQFPVLSGAETLIFGHTPTVYYQKDNPLSVWRGAGAIDVDCGSGFPEKTSFFHPQQGRLACLCLEDEREFYSE